MEQGDQSQFLLQKQADQLEATDPLPHKSQDDL